jgi:predicted ATPase/transposase
MLGAILAGRYHLLELVGSGGMGVVYRAADRHTGGTVAVKLLPPHLTGDPAYVGRLRREARLTAMLTSPRVVRVIDLDAHEGRPFLVMEYIAGPTLADHLRAHGRLSVPDALAIGVEIARALAAANAAGIVHGDLKPQNIKLVDGQIKVLDFGLARATGAGPAGRGERLGTPEYSAPEVLHGTADARADLYALGVILYELLAGRRPFLGRTAAAVPRGQSAVPPPLPADVPAPVREVVARCLARAPADRFPSAVALEAALLDCLPPRHRDGPPSAPAAGADLPPTLPMPAGGRRGGPHAAHTPTRPLPARRAAPRAAAALPAPLTDLVGRGWERAEVARLLMRTRLLTLTGAGGCGKTRLALAVAADVAGAFADGVRFVALAPVRDTGLVGTTIAQALGVRETGGRPAIEGLKDFLRDKHLLLVLDNFEQVAAAAPLISDLLAEAARLHVLVTSRAMLRLSGEYTFPVPPLALPGGEGREPGTGHSGERGRKGGAGGGTELGPAARVGQAPAVQLFVARAAAACPGFALTDEGAATVAAICARLDGLPLAIELAAARVRLLPPEALLRRLRGLPAGADGHGGALALLTGGARDLPARQQTLRDTIAWSYDLLSAGEQALFRQLAVFAGGFTPAVAAAVVDMPDTEPSAGHAPATRAPGAPQRARELRLLDGLGALLDQSLLRQEADTDDGEPRFTMLETLREFAWERLAATGGLERVQARHAAAFLALAEAAGPGLRGPEGRRWTERLEREHDNFRAALTWCRDAAVVTGLRLVGALYWFWARRSELGEGRTWAEALLVAAAAAGPAPADALAGALLCAAGLAWLQEDHAAARAHAERGVALARHAGDQAGTAHALAVAGLAARKQRDLAAARAHGTESLALFRAAGDEWGTAFALFCLGLTARDDGEADTARALYQESLARFRALGDDWGMALPLSELGVLAFRSGDFVTARPYLEEGVALFRELGDKRDAALWLPYLGEIARAEGDLARAAACYEEGLALFRDLGHRGGCAVTLRLLGTVARARGDAERAAACLRECLPLARAAGLHATAAAALVGLASVQAGWGRAHEAARLLAAADAVITTHGLTLDPADQAEQARALAAVRNALDERTFAAAWAAGRTVPPTEAATAAPPAAGGRTDEGDGPAPARVDGPMDLTDAEWAAVAPLLPPRAATGRPRADDRRVLDGILYVLSTGCGWQALPARYGSGKTVRRRLRALQSLGLWEPIVAALRARRPGIGGSLPGRDGPARP